MKQPSFQILICLVQIWNMKDPKKPLDVPDKTLMITECESIDIEESYKKLIGTASVRFPRGTVIHTTVSDDNVDKVKTDSKLTVSTDAAGIVEEVRKDVTEIAKLDNFKVGQRIRIYLGYTEDTEVAKMGKLSCIKDEHSIFKNSNSLREYQSKMDMMFDGYITKIGMDTPIELECENLASTLRTVTCPAKAVLSSKSTVNCLLADGDKGKYHMLEGTGLKLHPSTEKLSFDLGRIELPEDITVADVLTNWSQYGVHSFVVVENNQPYLMLGRNYFYDAKADSIMKIKEKQTAPVKILFDYNVASNGLRLTRTDKKFLAVDAQGLNDKDNFIRLTIIKNTKYDPSDPSKGKPYRVVNKGTASRAGVKRGKRIKKDVNMKMYSVIPYISSTRPITEEELEKEAYKYLESYNSNGIDGDLTLFGDLHLHTACKVELVDNRYPGKNGIYFVNDVHTSFGTGGYRQSIKLPYCLKRNKEKNND